MLAKDVMSKEVLALKPTASLREAAITLSDEGVGGCPVVDDTGRIVGMLSEVDILEALKTKHKELRMLMPPEILFGISFVEIVKEREALAAFKEVEGRTVADVMTKKIHAVRSEDKVERAIELMVQHKIHRVPVVDGGKVVGIVTRGDVLRGFFRDVGHLTYRGAL